MSAPLNKGAPIPDTRSPETVAADRLHNSFALAVQHLIEEVKADGISNITMSHMLIGHSLAISQRSIGAVRTRAWLASLAESIGGRTIPGPPSEDSV